MREQQLSASMLATFELVARLRARDDQDSKDAADLILWFADNQETWREAYRQATTFPDNPDVYVVRKDPVDGLGVIYTDPKLILSVVTLHDTGARAEG